MSRKSNSVLDKLIPLGTIQRSKQQKKEIEDMNAEGITAIQQIQSVNLDPEIYQLRENEERSALEISERKKLEPLIKILIGWINDALTDKRVIVKDLQEDLYDGQILHMLIQKLTASDQQKAEILNLGEISKKQYLRSVVDSVNELMGVHAVMVKWKVDSIYDKDLISILHILVGVFKLFKVTDICLPENLSVKVIVIQKKKKLEKITVVEKITGSSGDVEIKKKDRDAFDALFDHAPEKLNLVKNSLLTFIRKHLEKISMSIESLDPDVIRSGVHLLMLMGILEGYYIPDYAYHADASTLEQRIVNCKLLFEFIDEAGMQRPNCLAEDIACGDLKSILRTLYTLFSNYKDRD